MKQKAIFGFIFAFTLLQAAEDTNSLLSKISHLQSLYKTSAQELKEILNFPNDHVPIISAADLKQKFAAKEDILVINVLPEKYYHDCHINGSQSAPLSGLIQQAESWDRDQSIIVYCALDACDAGEKAYMLLTCLGFKNVIDYKGGIKEWYQIGYPTNGPAESEYLHTKGFSSSQEEYKLYPDSIVCSKQICWIRRYEKDFDSTHSDQ